jgi:dolichol-phosphate mannosyltransferase
VDRSALEAFLALRERNRYIRGMFSWVGFRQVGVPYACPPRFAGRSKYTLRRMLRLASNGIVSFSDVPLRVALHAGFALAGLSIAYGVSAVVVKAAGVAVPGWTSIAVVTSFVGGFQLILIGVLGTYVGRIYDEVKARPLYLIRSAHGFGELPEPGLAVAASRRGQQPVGEVGQQPE